MKKKIKFSSLGLGYSFKKFDHPTTEGDENTTTMPVEETTLFNETEKALIFEMEKYLMALKVVCLAKMKQNGGILSGDEIT